MMWKTSLKLVLSVVLVGSIFIHPAQGKEYPTKPIELLCPYSAGSSFDLYSRIIADKVQKHLGQPMFVTNKPGGGGSTISADVISSKPDGYKLATLGTPYFALTVRTQKIPFDPGHLIPLANFVELKVGIQIKGDSSWKTLNDIVDYAKKNPGKVKWGHAGRGNTSYMGTITIFKRVGANTIDVPYKGSPEIVAALLGGHLDAGTVPHGVIASHVGTGSIRYLVAFSDKRYGDLPNVPCALELGFPEVAKLKSLLGVYAHKDTPEEIKKILGVAFKKVFEDPEFKQGIEKIGDEPRFGGPEFMMEAIKECEKLGVPILKELGIYIGN
jgi:tripartite-type tricarboxylate transporter receptor subunit TctC